MEHKANPIGWKIKPGHLPYLNVRIEIEFIQPLEYNELPWFLTR